MYCDQRSVHGIPVIPCIKHVDRYQLFKHMGQSKDSTKNNSPPAIQRLAHDQEHKKWAGGGTRDGRLESPNTTFRPHCHGRVHTKGLYVLVLQNMGISIAVSIIFFSMHFWRHTIMPAAVRLHMQNWSYVAGHVL